MPNVGQMDKRDVYREPVKALSISLRVDPYRLARILALCKMVMGEGSIESSNTSALVRWTMDSLLWIMEEEYDIPYPEDTMQACKYLYKNGITPKGLPMKGRTPTSDRVATLLTRESYQRHKRLGQSRREFEMGRSVEDEQDDLYVSTQRLKQMSEEEIAEVMERKLRARGYNGSNKINTPNDSLADENEVVNEVVSDEDNDPEVLRKLRTKEDKRQEMELKGLGRKPQ